MALSQKHRSSIYSKLEPILGEQEAEALLSQFPSRELDEPVTKEFVRAEIAGVHAEIAGVRAEFAGVHAEIAGLRAEMHATIREHTIWLVAAIFGATGLGVSLVTLLG